MYNKFDDGLNHFRFAAVSSLIVFFYTSNVQNVDPEEYGGMMEIIKEGFMTGFATFLVKESQNDLFHHLSMFCFSRSLGSFSIQCFTL